MKKQLISREARLLLEPRGRPYFGPTVTPGVSLGYRRIRRWAGTWSVRYADGKGGHILERIGQADDYEDAAEFPNGELILSFEQANIRARMIARGAYNDQTPVVLRNRTRQFMERFKTQRENAKAERKRAKASLNEIAKRNPEIAKQIQLRPSEK